ncbi:MAG: glycosyltransferase [Chloroflexota bacterium]|nr:glycosyltransferase [Chloroflexota bacterium]
MAGESGGAASVSRRPPQWLLGDQGLTAELPPFPEAAAVRHDIMLSVVVNNHNYGRFLPAALDSALGQQGARIEVVVVDDGSDDCSRDVIRGYGDRVRVVLQDNLGQRAAFNAGLDAARGDVVVFLDADDVLAPGTVAAVSDAFTRTPGTARVVFRLAVVDGEGRPNGRHLPSLSVALPNGDVRARVLARPDDLPWPPTSGNAFATWALRKVMPLHLDEERTGADDGLHSLVPLLGPVIALPGIGGAYRVHGGNAHASAGTDVERSRRILRRSQRSHAALADLARQLGYPRPRPRSVTIAAHRLVSLRLGGDGHPLPGDSRWRALVDGLAAAGGASDAGLLRRIAYAGWFVLAALGPRSLLRRLAAAAFQST